MAVAKLAAPTYLTLEALIQQNGQTYWNNSPVIADELFECVWPSYEVGAERVNPISQSDLVFENISLRTRQLAWSTYMHSEMFNKKCVLKNYEELTQKQLHQSLFLTKLPAAEPRYSYIGVPVDFTKFPATDLLKISSWQLIPLIQQQNMGAKKGYWK